MFCGIGYAVINGVRCIFRCGRRCCCGQGCCYPERRECGPCCGNVCGGNVCCGAVPAATSGYGAGNACGC